MECDEFLDGYSEYLDGLLSPSRAEAFEAHVEGCECCARYHRVMQRGLALCRDLPNVHGSPDFLPRLRHRIYHLEDGIPMSSVRPGGSAALVAVAAVGLLAFAWLPFATSVPVEVELPAVAARAPEPSVSRAIERHGLDLLSGALHATGASSASLFFGRGPFLSPASLGWTTGMGKLNGDFFASAGADLSGGPSFLAAMEQRAAFAR
jgi:anti-sigma factor RsiW